jgi:hypothetical protein
MRLRGVLVLAVLAALLGAPTMASAAVNSLHSPVLSPSSGTPSTMFVLRVTYSGTFPAVRVDAVVAGLALPMMRMSGTAESGAWQASTTLPPGVWPVVFTATTTRGNSPVLPGGSLAVSVPAAPPTPAPSAQRTPQDSLDGTDSDAPRASAPAAEPVPAQSEAPAEDAGQVPVAPSTTPSSGAGMPGTADGPDEPDEPDAGNAPAGADAGGEPAADEPTPVASASGSASDDAGAGPSPRGGSTDEPVGNGAPAEVDTAPPGEPAMHDDVAGIAPEIVAVWGALVAVAGGLIVAFVLRRQRRRSSAVAAMSAADETDALLRRRALRRARTVLPDDPIVASLGIDEATLARRSAARRHRSREDVS